MRSFLIILLFIFSISCTLKVAKFKLLSTRNINAAIPHDAGKTTYGEDCVKYFLIPSPKPSMEKAIQDALDKAGPDYDILLNATVKLRSVGCFYEKQCYMVNGVAISSKSIGSSNE